MIKIVALSLFISLAYSSNSLPENAQQKKLLEIEISNIQKTKGQVIIDIYSTKATWLKKPDVRKIISTEKDLDVISIDVPFGTYAISIFQDINKNGELERNFIGIPKEPIGFGNNYKPFGYPKFESASIQFSSSTQVQNIKLFKVF
ncbi:DUF2141 domain-containing protein [Haliscomenobacter hydrossis]|uniref:DUF2141 domain-containing protein n=1 Tax=Haliscomenobacter hydrossis (strain ATCC 27775 / DSM 1100 / LMG 10767 / O) TaxID=760192 RepID=F4L0F1_HALH1|nr:DUF2141 domain-containing protein [Haliscomenobacter hydrossis]AEE48463.1 Protein of unknown function DUF2141 [Haliscomenobacter hydrossis DSM 1100]